MSRGLHLGFESLGRDDHPEMGFLGSAAGHCLVVGVEMRVVVDLQEAWLQRFGDLASVRSRILISGSWVRWEYLPAHCILHRCL
jgi:hypothetical protein